MTAHKRAIDTLLHEQFGHKTFRPGQRDVIDALLRGRDVLTVLPTGAGKSLVYQLTAQLLPRATAVVSLLLALMQDQVESLQASGVPVGMINSALRRPGRRGSTQDCRWARQASVCHTRALRGRRISGRDRAPGSVAVCGR